MHLQPPTVSHPTDSHCPTAKTPSTPTSLRLHCPTPASKPTRALPHLPVPRQLKSTEQAQTPPRSSSPQTTTCDSDPIVPSRELTASAVPSSSNFDNTVNRVVAFFRRQFYCDLVIPGVVAEDINCVCVIRNRYPDLLPKLLERFRYIPTLDTSWMYCITHSFQTLCRYTYNVATSTLTIRGMPTKSHDTLAKFFGSGAYLIQLIHSPVFTPPERACIQPWVSNVALPGSSQQARGGSNELGRREKLGDYALPEDANEQEPVFPNVIMEVGFS